MRNTSGFGSRPADLSRAGGKEDLADATLEQHTTHEDRVDASDYKDRKAPYAPVSAFVEFLDKIPDKSVPPRVDRPFLQKLNVGLGNEWALLSALKFLGIIDAQGSPTTAYRHLLDSDRRQETLRSLFEAAYAPLLGMGGTSMGSDDLVNYFRIASSPSQAKNAARFFRSVAQLAGERAARPAGLREQAQPSDAAQEPARLAEPAASSDRDTILAEAKARLLDKLPAPDPKWSAAEYAAIMDRFLEILHHLDS